MAASLLDQVLPKKDKIMRFLSNPHPFSDLELKEGEGPGDYAHYSRNAGRLIAKVYHAYQDQDV